MDKSLEWFSLPECRSSTGAQRSYLSGSQIAPTLASAAIQEEELLRFLWLILLALVTIPLAGCELAGDIFQAGVWVGVIVIVGIIAIVGFIAARIRG